MKNIKIKLGILMLILLPIFVSASAIEDVDYKVSDVYMSVEVDIVGSLHVKEAIVVKGSLNGFRREINYKNDNLKSWEKGDVDLANSSIYNAKGISIKKVSAMAIDKEDIDWKILDINYSSFVKIASARAGEKDVYTLLEDADGTTVRIFDPNESGYKVYYYEYFIDQAVVLHEDVAELYYTLFKLDDDGVDHVNIQVTTPGVSTDKTFRAWAHGPLNGTLSVISGTKRGEEETYKGALLKVDGYDGKDPIEIRMTFDKELVSTIPGALNESGIDALEGISEIEKKLSQEADKKKLFIKIIYYGTCTFASLYLVGLVILWVHMYRKYDKEYNVGFDAKYYREFTGDYEVEVVDYLMKKDVTTAALNASIMNLIYKKNIVVEESAEKKNDFILTLKNDGGLNDSETILIDLLFKTIGKDGKVSLKEIEKFSSKFETAEKFMKKYDAWKMSVLRTAKAENFFEEHITPKAIGGLYFALGILIFIFLIFFQVKYFFLHIAVFVGAMSFLIYTLSFKKWTKKGREHYLKWNAFKNFLTDFGSFKEKEIPEIALWDKYLVYATVFGIAKEVQKAMKVQLSSLGIEEDSLAPNIFYYRNFYMMNSLNTSFNKAHTNSVTTVNAHNAESTFGGGSGFGGGFSGGGGFAGGGGGGGGF